MGRHYRRMKLFDRSTWSPTLSRVAAGFAIGLAGAGLIYTAAATSAGLIAESFTTVESARHGRAVEFNDGLARASAERTSLLDRCERLQGTKRRACISVVNTRQKRAASE
jgi:hypothetical protein